jgi:hypothetical protein
MNRRTVLGHWIRHATWPRIAVLPILAFVVPLALQFADTAERRHTEQLVLRGLESTGTVHYVRDSEGVVTGIDIQLRGSATTGAATSGTL